MRVKFLPIILVVLASAGPANIVHAETYRVPSDAMTIAAALDSPSVTMILVEGTHYEDTGRITMVSGITIMVDPDQPGLPTIDALGDPFAVVFPEVTANTTLDGFRLTGFTLAGVKIGLDSGFFETREVRNCVIEGTGAELYGIYVENSTALISNVRISGFTSGMYSAGIALDGAGGLNIPMTVENSVVTESTNGVVIDAGENPITIRGCTFYDNYHGIQLVDGDSAVVMQENLAVGNSHGFTYYGWPVELIRNDSWGNTYWDYKDYTDVLPTGNLRLSPE